MSHQKYGICIKGDDMDKNKLKKISIYSFIIGIILGVTAIIPFLQILSVIIMSIISGILVVIYMERKAQIGQLTIKGAGIIGAYIGLVSLIGFLIIYLPLAAVLGAIFEYLVPNSIYFSGIKFLIQIWWLLILMGGLITALFNSFALISYIYIRDTYFMIEGKKDIKGNFKPRNKDGF